MSKEVIKRMVTHYHNVTKSITTDISKHTIQLFYETDKGKQPYATAILIKFQNNHFILSAAHVLEMQDMPKILFELNREENGITTFKNIGKYELITTQKVSSKRINDKIDIAVLKLLGEDDINLLNSNFKFYNFEEAGVEHESILFAPYYIVFGYPGTYTKLKNKYKKESTRRVLVLNSRINEFSNCENYDFNSELNIFIDYPKKIKFEGNEQLIPPPNPKGISGCGLWCITDSVNIQSKKWHYQLVGIMIEVHKERILVATNLKNIHSIIEHSTK